MYIRQFKNFLILT